ncbi:MAG: hypothetical protein AB1589_16585 [Cyanobacteriota bacterium]
MKIQRLANTRGIARTKALSILTLVSCFVFGGACPATSSVDQKSLPLEWSMLPLTTEQLAAVRDCNIAKLESDRYSEKLAVRELLQVYTPNSACDWAVLAWAYAKRTKQNEQNENKLLLEEGKQALERAIAENPGFVFAAPIFYSYFGQISLVKPPPFAQQEITTVKIQYGWGGLGNPVKYTVNISQANTKPVVSGTVQGRLAGEQQISGNIDKKLVQALAPALSDLLPIDSQFNMLACTDNYPDWSVLLTFKDGTTLELVTQGSTLMYAGGPWQTKIDQQNYMQFSPAFFQSLASLVEALKLPWGEPMGMACAGGQDVLKQAFPER